MAIADTLPTRNPEPRILIVRLSALGDLVFATSLLEALRERWPKAYIAWIAQSGFAGLLDGDRRLDALIRVTGEVFKRPTAAVYLRRELRRHQFDWVIDAQGLLKSRWIARLVPQALRIGFESKEPAAFWMDHQFPKGGDVRDIASEYRFLAEQLTGRSAHAPTLPVCERSRQAVRGLMREQGVEPGFIALCPFTTRAQKHWPEHHWAELAHRIAERGLGPCAVLGGPGDRDAADRIMAEMPEDTVDLVGETRLAHLPAWLAQARAVVGVDTGLTHLGVALRKPVVALFGSTCPYTGGADSPLTVLYDALPCAPCKRHPTCGGAFTCMSGLTPERVVQALTPLLDRPT